MGRKAKFSKEIKLKAVKEYLAGSKSSHIISDEIGCHHTMILSWVKVYEQLSESAFNDKSRNKTYTKEFKMTVINEYIKSGGSKGVDTSAKDNNNKTAYDYAKEKNYFHIINLLENSH